MTPAAPDTAPDTDRSTDARLLLLDGRDNVLVARVPLAPGETLLIEGRRRVLSDAIGLGHKLARRPIAAGDAVLKYGAPIGTASRDIAPGDHVHLHNLQSSYTATHALEETP